MSGAMGRLERLELTAGGLSGLCLIHCLALPIVGLLLPTLAIDPSPLVHVVLLALTVPLALITLMKRLRRHGVRWPLVVGVCGLVGLASAAVVPERLLILSGGAALLTGHLANWRLRHEEGYPCGAAAPATTIGRRLPSERCRGPSANSTHPSSSR